MISKTFVPLREVIPPAYTTKLFSKKLHSDLLLPSQYVLNILVRRWVEYMQDISSCCTSISALAFAVGSSAGESQYSTFYSMAYSAFCGPFPFNLESKAGP